MTFLAAHAGGHPSGCPHRAGLILSKKKDIVPECSLREIQSHCSTLGYFSAKKITDFAGIAANRDNPKYLQDVSGYS